MSKEPSAYYAWLNELKKHEIHYFLEGGQAVNLWAFRFIGDNAQLEKYLPFTSKDCDIWIDSDAFKRIGGILNGSFKKSNSPLDGQLGIITSRDKELVLDLLKDVFGLNNNELKSAEDRSLDIEGIQVIDPIYLFKGKCRNLASLPQRDRNDTKHILMLSLIIPQYIRGFLKALNAGESNDPRDLKNEIKLLLSFEKDRFVKQAMDSLGLTFKELIPLEAIYSCSDEYIKKYAEGSLKRLFKT